MSNNKQSSVEWLSNQSYELFEQYSEGNFDRITLNKLMLKATEQAKAMHKEEIEEAWDNAAIDATYGNKFSSPTQYYNEHYGNN